MDDTNENWQRQERDLIDEFFLEKAPRVLGPAYEIGAARVCTELECIEFAKKAVCEADDVGAVDNQGCNSFTVHSPSRGIVVQFRLRKLESNITHLASQIYGDNVPDLVHHGGFPLPVYSCRTIPGTVHFLQPFPKTNFPLQREKTTVADLARFVARAASFEQPRAYAESSWTSSAAYTFNRLANNTTLERAAPELIELVRTIQPHLHLLETLPAVLTHTDFASSNILVDDDGHVTGVLDFDEAEVDAFGMCIWGLYECFFGEMEEGKWEFHNMSADGHLGKTVREVLEDTFWEALWTHLPPRLHLQGVEKAVKVALSVGVVNRYFVQGRMLDEVDVSKPDHQRSLEYASGILPAAWKYELSSYRRPVSKMHMTTYL